MTSRQRTYQIQHTRELSLIALRNERSTDHAPCDTNATFRVFPRKYSGRSRFIPQQSRSLFSLLQRWDDFRKSTRVHAVRIRDVTAKMQLRDRLLGCICRCVAEEGKRRAEDVGAASSCVICKQYGITNYSPLWCGGIGHDASQSPKLPLIGEYNGPSELQREYGVVIVPNSAIAFFLSGRRGGSELMEVRGLGVLILPCFFSRSGNNTP